MFSTPKHDHALQQGCARAARAHKEVKQRSCNRRRTLRTQRKAILCRRDLKKLHFPSHVVQRGDEQVHSPVHGMELRVLRLRQPNLAQQLSYKADVSSRIVAILDQPLRQRCRGQRSTARVREERLLRGIRKRRCAYGEQMRRQTRCKVRRQR